MIVVGSVHPQGGYIHIVEISGSIKVGIHDPGMLTWVDGVTLMAIRIREESASIYRDSKLKSVIDAHNGTG